MARRSAAEVARRFVMRTYPNTAADQQSLAELTRDLARLVRQVRAATVRAVVNTGHHGHRTPGKCHGCETKAAIVAALRAQTRRPRRHWQNRAAPLSEAERRGERIRGVCQD